jgi:hypothetical protein
LEKGVLLARNLYRLRLVRQRRERLQRAKQRRDQQQKKREWEREQKQKAEQERKKRERQRELQKKHAEESGAAAAANRAAAKAAAAAAAAAYGYKAEEAEANKAAQVCGCSNKQPDTRQQTAATNGGRAGRHVGGLCEHDVLLGWFALLSPLSAGGSGQRANSGEGRYGGKCRANAHEHLLATTVIVASASDYRYSWCRSQKRLRS